MFFKKNKYNLDKIAALLIHAAKIDENYSEQEKKIIEQTLLNIGANIQKLWRKTPFKSWILQKR